MSCNDLNSFIVQVYRVLSVMLSLKICSLFSPRKKVKI